MFFFVIFDAREGGGHKNSFYPKKNEYQVNRVTNVANGPTNKLIIMNIIPLKGTVYQFWSLLLCTLSIAFIYCHCSIVLSRWTTVCCQGIAPASLLKYVSGKNPLVLIAQIYYFTLDARELTRPMCINLSRVARAAIACRVSLAWRSRPMCLTL